MKLRSVGQFNDAIAKEFAWRRKELTEIKNSIPMMTTSTQAMMIRAGVALLYAHWEGFVKQAANLYLEFVRGQRLRYNQLCLGILAHCLRSRLTGVAESGNPTTHIDVLGFVLNELEGRAKIPMEGAVRTKSNLNSERFKRVILLLGLNYSPYEPQEHFIDYQLLNWRNEIAHGEYQNPTKTDYDSLYTRIVTLITQFKNDIENSALTQGYLA